MATIKLSGFAKVSLVRIFQADKLVKLTYSKNKLILQTLTVYFIFTWHNIN